MDETIKNYEVIAAIIILTREIQNLFINSNDSETLNQCADYLLNSMDGEVLLGKVDFLLKKVTHSEARSCLNQLKINAEKNHTEESN